jgi:hypothetical protein
LRAVSHGGSVPGMHGLVVAYLERTDAMVILTNGDNGRELITDVLLAAAEGDQV